MRFRHCPDCGQTLGAKEIGDEGLVPYCEACGRPWFDMFASCVIVLVTREDGRVALLRQDYMSTQYRVLVSGYMKPGERAEDTARREVQEEIGVTLGELRLIGTQWFGKRDMLMIAFIGRAENTDLTLSGEVDSADWFEPEEAIRLVHPKGPGNASYYLMETYLRERQQAPATAAAATAAVQITAG